MRDALLEPAGLVVEAGFAAEGEELPVTIEHIEADAVLELAQVHGAETDQLRTSWNSILSWLREVQAWGQAEAVE